MRAESIRLMKVPVAAIQVSMFLLCGLVGCNLPGSSLATSPTGSPPAQYETVAVMLSETAAVSTASPIASQPASTVTPPAPPSATPTPPTAENPTLNPSPTALCDLAGAGIPIDVTIPDDSHMQPGESFVKTWRLVNLGECTWTRNYTVTWFSGDNLGVRNEEPFNNEVAPGSSIDLSIDMVAPTKAGVYQSNWKLSNARGDLFGIGPGGGAPFWVRIQVEAVATQTATVVPATATPTPQVSSLGSASLKPNDGIDIDSGQVGSGDQIDFLLEGDTTQLILSPVNNAKVTLHGGAAPDLDACQASDLSAQPILLGADLEGSYFCVQTSRGLPGRMQISAFNLSEPSISLVFTVWSVP